MIESLKKELEAHPDNPFLQGHVEALTAAEEKRNARRSAVACSPSSLTPETDAMASMRRATAEWIELASKMERERNFWRKEHDRAVCEYQHRLMELATSAITASHYPESEKSPDAGEKGKADE